MGGDNIRSARRQRKGRAWLPCREEGKDVPSSPKARLGGETGTNRSNAAPRDAPRHGATPRFATQLNVFMSPSFRPATNLPAAAKWSSAGPASPYLPFAGPSCPKCFAANAAGGFGLFLFLGG
jgi:hypothetical protein